MTKKDYKIIADVFKGYWINSREYTPEEWKLVIDIINDMQVALVKDNPNFNPIKFLDYLRK